MKKIIKLLISNPTGLQPYFVQDKIDTEFDKKIGAIESLLSKDIKLNNEGLANNLDRHREERAALLNAKRYIDTIFEGNSATWQTDLLRYLVGMDYDEKLRETDRQITSKTEMAGIILGNRCNPEYYHKQRLARLDELLDKRTVLLKEREISLQGIKSTELITTAAQCIIAYFFEYGEWAKDKELDDLDSRYIGKKFDYYRTLSTKNNRLEKNGIQKFNSGPVWRERRKDLLVIQKYFESIGKTDVVERIKTKIIELR